MCSDGCDGDVGDADFEVWSGDDEVVEEVTDRGQSGNGELEGKNRKGPASSIQGIQGTRSLKAR